MANTPLLLAFRRNWRRALNVRKLLEKSRFYLPTSYTGKCTSLCLRITYLLSPVLPSGLDLDRWTRDLEHIIRWSICLHLSLRLSPLHPEYLGQWYKFERLWKMTLFNELEHALRNSEWMTKTEHHGQETNDWGQPLVKIAGASVIYVHIPGNGDEEAQNVPRGTEKFPAQTLKERGYRSRLISRAPVWCEWTPKRYRYFPADSEMVHLTRLVGGQRRSMSDAVALSTKKETMTRSMETPSATREMQRWLQPLAKSAVVAGLVGCVAYAVSPLARAMVARGVVLTGRIFKDYRATAGKRKSLLWDRFRRGYPGKDWPATTTSKPATTITENRLITQNPAVRTQDHSSSLPTPIQTFPKTTSTNQVAVPGSSATVRSPSVSAAASSAASEADAYFQSPVNLISDGVNTWASNAVDFVGNLPARLTSRFDSAANGDQPEYLRPASRASHSFAHSTMTARQSRAAKRKAATQSRTVARSAASASSLAGKWASKVGEAWRGD